MAKNKKTDFLIPDSTRLAQYNPVFTIEDLTKNLSDKYKKLATEIRNIIHTLLKQNSNTQDQINFRLANKFLLDEWVVLNKFINDESFSPDLDILVATQTDKAIEELGDKIDLNQTKLSNLKDSLIKLFKKQTEQFEQQSKKIEKQLNDTVEKQLKEQAATLKSSGTKNFGISSPISFTSFDGIKYYTGWLTASFTNTFKLTQTNLFNNINDYLKNTQDITVSIGHAEIQKTIDSMANSGQDVITSQQSAQMKLARRLNKLADVITTITNKRLLRHKILGVINNGYQSIVNGFKGLISHTCERIKDFGLAAVQKTYDAAKSVLKKIVSLTTWSISKVLSSSVTWGIAAWLLWKYWLKDKVGDTLINWMTEFSENIKKRLGIEKEGSPLKIIIDFVKEAVYDRYIKKFVDWFDKKWGPRIDEIKKFIETKVDAVVNWAKKWMTKLKPIYDNAKSLVNWLAEGWEFIFEKLGKILNISFDKFSGNFDDMIEGIKEAGEWIWGVLTGKKSLKEVKTDFVKNVWIPTVNAFKGVMCDIKNFAIINGNWILDTLGIKDFDLGSPTDLDGNILPLEKQKSIFEIIAEGFTGFEKDGPEIKLGEGRKLVITPERQGRNGFMDGFKVQFVSPDKFKETTIPGINDATKKLTEIKESLETFAHMAVIGGGTFVGGFIGEWVGRAAAILVTIVSAVSTGGVSLAGLGTASDIGGAAGSIIGSMIGYFFTRSLLSSRDYFESPIRESLADEQGISEKAAETFDTAWTIKNTRKAIGLQTARGSKNDVNVVLKNDVTNSDENGKLIETTAGQDNDSVLTSVGFRLFDPRTLGQSERQLVNTLGKYNRDVSNVVHKGFKMALGSPDVAEDMALINAVQVGEGEQWLAHYDNNLEDYNKFKERRYGAESLKTIVDFMKDSGKSAMMPNWAKSPGLYTQLTTTGNKWIDKMLAYIMNSKTFNAKVWLEDITSHDKMGDWRLNLRNPLTDGTRDDWGFNHLLRFMLTMRMGLSMFLFAVQNSIHTASQLISNPTDGESSLMKAIVRLLWTHIILRKSESDYHSFADVLRDEIAGWYKDKRFPANELVNDLRNFDPNRHPTMFSMGWNVRVKNILDTIRKYTDLIVNNGGVKYNDKFITRDEISKIFIKYPTIIEAFLSHGEIGETFDTSNNPNALPKNNLGNNDDERMRRLVDLFGLADTSDIDQLNTQFSDILKNFSEIAEMGNDEESNRMRSQIQAMLNKVKASDWQEKIKKRIANGLLSKQQYEELMKKFEQLKRRLDDEYMLRVGEDENGIIYVVYESLSMRQKEERDSSNTTGQHQY